MIAAEALAGASPSLFYNAIDDFGIASVLSRGFPLGEDLVRFKTRDAQELEASSGRKRTEASVTGRLRAKALAVRSREEPATLPSPPPDPLQRLIRQRPAAPRLVLGTGSIHWSEWPPRSPCRVDGTCSRASCRGSDHCLPRSLQHLTESAGGTEAEPRFFHRR
jgi:hypothetical protein